MIIKILTDYSYTPGPRYEFEGPYSGEVFRQTILMPALRKAIQTGEKITVDLDDTAGYGRSFLEETFGGLIRVERIPYETVNKHIEVISEDEPKWKEKITSYLRNAHEKENI